MEAAVASELLQTGFDSKNLSLLHADKGRYTSWVKDVKVSFQAYQGHYIHSWTTPSLTSVRNRDVGRDEANKPLGVERFVPTNYGTGKAVELNPLCCNVGRCKAVLDAQLVQITVCLQQCPQHTTDKEMCSAQSVGERYRHLERLLSTKVAQRL